MGRGRNSSFPFFSYMNGVLVQKENIELLVGLLGVLRALKWNYWNSHWMAKGTPYYGDHLLFERLYSEVIDDQIDTLAEKITSEDPNILASSLMRRAFNKFLETNEVNHNPFQRGLAMEEHFQRTAKIVYQELKNSDDLSLGMDDFIMATANERETVIYLLRQRTRG